MPKAKFDYELFKKYLPDNLSMEQFIYSHYKTMANIKKLTEEKQKMQEVQHHFGFAKAFYEANK